MYTSIKACKNTNYHSSAYDYSPWSLFLNLSLTKPDSLLRFFHNCEQKPLVSIQYPIKTVSKCQTLNRNLRYKEKSKLSAFFIGKTGSALTLVLRLAYIKGFVNRGRPVQGSVIRIWPPGIQKPSRDVPGRLPPCLKHGLHA
jgi:hypothetical protein